jgi:hypothetical protein
MQGRLVFLDTVYCQRLFPSSRGLSQLGGHIIRYFRNPVRTLPTSNRSISSLHPLGRVGTDASLTPPRFVATFVELLGLIARTPCEPMYRLPCLMKYQVSKACKPDIVQSLKAWYMYPLPYLCVACYRFPKHPMRDRRRVSRPEPGIRSRCAFCSGLPNKENTCYVSATQTLRVWQ